MGKSHPRQKNVAQVVDRPVSPETISPVRFCHSIGDLFYDGLGRNAKSLGKPENHIQRGRPDRLLKPRNVAPLQAAIPGEIRLAPSLAKPPANDDLRKTRTELIDFVQKNIMTTLRLSVAVTIGPVSGRFVLTRTLDAASTLRVLGVCEIFTRSASTNLVNPEKTQMS